MKCGHCGSVVPDDLAICSVCKKPVVAQAPDSDMTMCPCCGESNFKGLRICAKCGTPLAVPRESGAAGSSPSARPKRRKKGRLNPKFVAAVALFFIIVVAAAALVLISIFKKDGAPPGRLQSFYAAGGGYTQFVSGGEALGKTAGSVVLSAASLDGSAEAVLTDGGKLYHISPSGAEDVSANVVFCAISADGTAIPYLVDNGADAAVSDTAADEADATRVDGETEPAETLYDKSARSLFLYDCAKKTSTLIANNVSGSSVAVSPDGKTVSYTIAAADSKSFEGYLCNDGIFTSAGKNTCVVAVSDKAQYVYSLKYESGADGDIIKLFAQSAGAEVKLGEFGTASGLTMCLNASASEVLFSLNGRDGNYFLSVGCAEKKRMSDGFSPVLPYAETLMTVSGTQSAVYVCPAATFAQTAFVSAADTLCYIDKTFTPVDVCAGVAQARVSLDGETLYYTDGSENLYACPTGSLSPKNKLAAHVDSFEISPDGRRCYYIDRDHALYRCSDETAVLIATDVSNLWVTRNDTVYFLENVSFNSGRLCSAKGGAQRREVDGADNVHTVTPDFSDNIYYRSDYSDVSGTFDLWYGGADTFTRLFDDFGR